MSASQTDISRRQFSLLAAAALLGPSLVKAAEPARPTNAFFAMDTAARGDAKTVVPLLKELGYDGLGGKAGDTVMPEALKLQGLKFFNGYHTANFDVDQPGLDAKLKSFIDALKGYDSALWMAIAKVTQQNKPLKSDDPAAEKAVLDKLRALADYAEPLGVRIALYPHTGSWLSRFEQGVHLADKVDHPSIGATFNLCHWLKVEGSERDPGPLLAAAKDRLMFVTINGADTGDTQKMGWDRLIRPLGEGTYDVPRFLATKVRAAGYTGPIGYQGYGIKMDPRELLTRTMKGWQAMQFYAPPQG